ncbi:MAG: hypothetical protein H6R38_408 [Deltaproteobacteria bacterium]|nr:hypothetical protein [Deltaproteobacteria bacterium]
MARCQFSWRHGAVPVLLVVEAAHHEGVGDDDPRGFRRGCEKTHRVPRGHDQGLLAGEDFQVAPDQPVLHPVLADLAGLAVGHQFVGVEGDLEVEVVVDHHLEGLALDAAALVLVDGPALDRPRRAEAVAVDPTAPHQLLQELRRQRPVPLGGDVAQGVLEGERGVLLRQVELPGRCTADAFHELRHRRQLVEKGSEMNLHGLGDVGVGDHDGFSLTCFPSEDSIGSVILDYRSNNIEPDAIQPWRAVNMQWVFQSRFELDKLIRCRISDNSRLEGGVWPPDR